MLTPLRLVAAASLAAVLPAQTFVVDANNGPGTDFTSLSTALATVPDGAAVVVRAGLYQTPATITVAAKGLTILGEPGAVAVGVTFTGLSANQAVVVKAMQFGVTGVGGALEFQNCAGRVHVEDCGNSPLGLMELSTTACSQVSIVRCAVRAADFVLSNVVCVGCTVQPGLWADAGITITGGRAQLARCAVVGGVSGHTSAGYPAITMNGGELRLLGPGTLTAGVPTQRSIGGNGIVRTTSTFALGGAPPAPTISLAVVDEASASSTNAPLGGTVTAELRGSANLVGGLVFGVPSPPATFPGIAEELWVDPVGFVVVGPLGAPLTFWTDVPNAVVLRGLTFGWQGLTVGPAGAVLSNPAWFCLQ